MPVQIEEGSITSSEMFLVILFGVLFSVYFSLLLELIYKRITKSYLNAEHKSFWFYISYANKNLLKVSVIFFKSFVYIFLWTFFIFIFLAIFMAVISYFLSNFEMSEKLVIFLNTLKWLIPIVLTLLALCLMVYRSFQLIFVVPAFVDKPRLFKDLKKESISLVEGQMLYVGWIIFLFSLCLMPYFIAMIAIWVTPLVFSLVVESNFFYYLIASSLVTVVFSVITSVLYSVAIYQIYINLKY